MQSSEISFRVSERIILTGNLTVPADAHGLVIFSHGSGSSRFSPRNRHVAEVLNDQGMATLLTDLLTETEDQLYLNRFDIDLLTQRLMAVTRMVKQRPQIRDLPVGYFGASTGAASALKAAARLPEMISAVVSRGGRPDLAFEELAHVKCPTLLLVGSLDTDVIWFNREAMSQLTCNKTLHIIEGASHLFEEKGKLDSIAELAGAWFTMHLADQQLVIR